MKATEVATDLLSCTLPNGWGWYLFGVTTRGTMEEHVLAVSWMDGRTQARVLPQGDVNVIVSEVPLIEFSPAAMRARLRDAAWLEAMVRGHERVVEAVQRQRTVLPSKFGCVYPGTASLIEALDTRAEMLLAQLERLDHCEEWGVQLYARSKSIQQRMAVGQGAVAQLQADLASAQPGRAYFLRRKLADVLAAATEQAIADVGQHAYDHLLRFSIAGEISRLSDGHRIETGEVEALRAAFLVSVASRRDFLAAVEDLAASQPGLRCDYSGPWAPYSFANLAVEVLR